MESLIGKRVKVDYGYPLDNEIFDVISESKEKVEVAGDFSAGTNNVYQSEWINKTRIKEFIVDETEDDFFLSDRNCIDRLFEEWKKYNSLIIAYDFDSTVFDYYKKGRKFPKLIKIIRECKAIGFHLTVFTSCNEDRMPEIKKYLADNDIPYHSINETPEYIPFKGRKIYFNLLLDDRGGLNSAYDQLETVIAKIRSHKATELIPKEGY